MRYLLRYEIPSKYNHFNKLLYKEFVNLQDLRLFLIDNIDKIMIYWVYKLSDLTGK